MRRDVADQTGMTEALLAISEGFCPACRDRLVPHRDTRDLRLIDARSGAAVTVASNYDVKRIPDHGYCPSCRLCVQDETRVWDEAVYSTWTGCPLIIDG